MWNIPTEYLSPLFNDEKTKAMLNHVGMPEPLQDNSWQDYKLCPKQFLTGPMGEKKHEYEPYACEAETGIPT